MVLFQQVVAFPMLINQGCGSWAWSQKCFVLASGRAVIKLLFQFLVTESQPGRVRVGVK